MTGTRRIEVEIWKENDDSDRIHLKLVGVDDDKTYTVNSRRNHGSPLLFRALNRLLESDRS